MVETALHPGRGVGGIAQLLRHYGDHSEVRRHELASCDCGGAAAHREGHGQSAARGRRQRVGLSPHQYSFEGRRLPGNGLSLLCGRREDGAEEND